VRDSQIIVGSTLLTTGRKAVFSEPFSPHLTVLSLIGCLHDPAKVQQTSSKFPANVEQLTRVFWIHLLEVCWTFAGSCKRSIRLVTHEADYRAAYSRYTCPPITTDTHVHQLFVKMIYTEVQDRKTFDPCQSSVKLSRLLSSLKPQWFVSKSFCDSEIVNARLRINGIFAIIRVNQNP